MSTRLCFVLPLMAVCATSVSADVVLLESPALPVAADSPLETAMHMAGLANRAAWRFGMYGAPRLTMRDKLPPGGAEAKGHNFLTAGRSEAPADAEPRSTSPPLVVVTGLVVGVLFLIRSRVGPMDERGKFNLGPEDRSDVRQRNAYAMGRRDRVPGALASRPF